MICIAVDDGHGRGTAGKRTPLFADGSYMEENEFNDGVAKELCRLLEGAGIQVLRVAAEESDVSLKTRVERANLAKVNAYVSIHANAVGGDWNDVSGVESWVREGSNQKTLDFAKAIHLGLTEAVKRKDRGLKKSDSLYILNQARMPAVLIECGFMTNREEALLLRTEDYRKLCAKGVFRGICNYFQIEIEGEEDMKRYISVSELPYGKETIEKLMKKGILSGDGKGSLNLSEDMLRIFVILDRAGLF